MFAKFILLAISLTLVLSQVDLLRSGTVSLSASDTLSNGLFEHSPSNLNDGYWDCVASHGWHSDPSSTPATHWIQASFPSGQIVTSYELKSSNGCYPSYPASNWVFEASNDGNVWTPLDTVSGSSTSNWVTRTISTSIPYSKFRVRFPDVTGYVEIYEMRIFGGVTGAWNCVPGIDVPVRINAAGDIECMSSDSTNCLWSTNNCAGVLANPPATIAPLGCGQRHLSLYGTTGYDSTNHWCFRAWESLKPWFCIPTLTTPLRLNPQGNPECLASNARDCAWGTVSCSSTTFYTPPATTTINPLVCGAIHLSTYGSTGYADPNHWCYRTVQTLEPNCLNSNQITFCSAGSSCGGTTPCPIANTKI